MFDNINVTHINNNVFPFDIKKTFVFINNSIEKIQKEEFQPDIIIFPKNCILGSSCINNNINLDILNLIEKEYIIFLEKTKNINSLIIFNKPYKNENVLSIIYKGKELHVVLSNKIETFHTKYFSFTLINKNLERTMFDLQFLKDEESDILIFVDEYNYNFYNFQKIKNYLTSIRNISNKNITYISGFLNDSSGKDLHKSTSIFIEDQNFIERLSRLDEIHNDFLQSNYSFELNGLKQIKTEKTYIDFEKQNSKKTIKNLKKDVFYEHFKSLNKNFLDELFDLQVESLSKRLKNISINNVVLPVSGGLDSTLALLVCIKTMKNLNLSSKNIITVTLPGLATSNKTYNNAVLLCENLNTNFFEIDIKNATLNHFKDINHDQNQKNVVYENAQARERTKIALNLANKHNAITIGTGDLSEDALGFCTFGGDQLANFNINASITKTIIKHMINNFINKNTFENISHVLKDIINTPISPELINNNDNKNIEQKTEEIIGDYILHDFFIYYLLKYNLSFSKIYKYACIAFKEDYSEEFILNKLKLFLKRFFKNQFKRNASCDFVSISDIDFHNSKININSDLNINIIEELL